MEKRLPESFIGPQQQEQHAVVFIFNSFSDAKVTTTLVYYETLRGAKKVLFSRIENEPLQRKSRLGVICPEVLAKHFQRTYNRPSAVPRITPKMTPYTQEYHFRNAARTAHSSSTLFARTTSVTVSLDASRREEEAWRDSKHRLP